MRIGVRLALAALGLGLLACSRAPSESSKVAPAASGSSIAHDPALTAVSKPAANDAAVWPTGFSYQYRVKVATTLELDKDQRAFDFDLTGTLRVIPGAVTSEGLPLYLTIDDAKIVSRIPGSQSSMDKVASEVGKTGCLVTFAGGRALDLRVVPGLSALSANIYRELGASLQFMRDGDNATYTTHEYDTTGEYVAEYRRASDPLRWQKQKLSYLGILASKTAQGQAPSRIVPKLESSSMSVDLAPSGRPLTIHAENRVLISGAQVPVRSLTSVSLEGGTEQPLADAGLDWPLLLTKTLRVPADEPYGATASVEALDDARIHGQTFPEIWARLVQRQGQAAAKSALDPDASQAVLSEGSQDFIALAALFRRKPETVALALMQIRAGARGSEALVDALGSSSSPKAQQALIELATSEKIDPKLKLRARRALTRVQRPTESAVSALRQMLEKKPFDQSAMFGLGSYSRRLRDQGEQARADALGELLLERLRAARTDTNLLNSLGALSNAGYAKSLDPVQRYLTDQRETVRAAAVRACQSIKDPAVERILATTLASDPASDVRISAMDAAQVREPTTPFTDALANAALTDTDTRVRYRAVELMLQWLRQRPDLRATLEMVASKDAEPKVRDRAKTAL